MNEIILNKHNIPSHIEALLFDLDGTLADTMPLHFQAWQKALLQHAIPFSEDKFYSMAGITPRRIVEILAEEHGIQLDVEAFSRHKENLFLELHHHVKPVKPVYDFFHEVKDLYGKAIVTGGTRAVSHATLDHLDLRTHFSVVVTADDVKYGKPHPESFLLAAEKLAVSPRACLVFEDGDPGLEAARRAGMTPIDIRSWR